MATQLLWDEWGDKGVLHTPQHDLEAFWWTIAWCVCNFVGPYQQVRKWPEIDDEKESLLTPEGDIREIIPCWLRPGNHNLKFIDIVKSRTNFAGNFDRFAQFVDDYWSPDPIMQGLRDMFNLFLPADLVSRQKQITRLNMDALNSANHDAMIDIVDKIIHGLSDPKYSETPLTLEFLARKRAAWTSRIRLTREAKLAAFDHHSGGDKHLTTFKMDLSVSAHEDADLYYQTYAGYPEKRKRGEDREETEGSGGRCGRRARVD
jgi:hypothetical protein